MILLVTMIMIDINGSNNIIDNGHLLPLSDNTNVTLNTMNNVDSNET